MMKKLVVTLLCGLVLSGCATSPPKNVTNLCEIFYERRDWYDAAKDAEDKWGAPMQVTMSMMFQESSFKADAQPPMEYWLGFIPVGRKSSAYGYSQAKTPTWNDYIRETGNSGADRDEFDDAIDFMSWFVSKTHKINKVSKWDAYSQYLNYHEGWGGYRKKTYRAKGWLVKVAHRVKHRASKYGSQLKGCRENLEHSWLWRLFFG